jgi:hypothetical protein
MRHNVHRSDEVWQHIQKIYWFCLRDVSQTDLSCLNILHVFIFLKIYSLSCLKLPHSSIMNWLIWVRLTPWLSRSGCRANSHGVFQLFGFTCGSAVTIMIMWWLNSLDFLTKNLDDIRFYSSACIFCKIIYYHLDIVWEIISKNEIHSVSVKWVKFIAKMKLWNLSILHFNIDIYS